jgi:hypothetical protein
MAINPQSLGIQMTPLVKVSVGTLIAAFVLQLVCINILGIPLNDYLYMHPFRSELWAPWQALTSFFFASDVLGAMLNWLVLAWFIPPAQDALGSKGLIRAVTIAAVGSMVLTTALDMVGVLNGGLHVGINPILTALVVIFGLSNPNATIRLFFVLPVQAKWVAYGSGLIALLFFLANRDLGSTMYLSGWLFAFGYMSMGQGMFKQWNLRRQARKTEKELGKFTVIRGGKDENGDDWIN